jgi:hypothetical protein
VDKLMPQAQCQARAIEIPTARRTSKLERKATHDLS